MNICFAVDISEIDLTELATECGYRFQPLPAKRVDAAGLNSAF